MKLNDYRLKKGWSYTKLAEMTGASHATVCRRWCLGYKHPQGKYLHLNTWNLYLNWPTRRYSQMTFTKMKLI